MFGWMHDASLFLATLLHSGGGQKNRGMAEEGQKKKKI
jgi:hypothetical protein